MRKLYLCRTRVGPFYIAESGGRFHPLFKNEDLGSYHTVAAAAGDLAAGHVPPIPGVDLSALDIPHDIKEWERL